MKSLQGKVAIVTGGGQGVGFGIAQALAAEGAHLVITGRDADKLKKAGDTLQSLGAEVLSVTGDVRQRAHAGEVIAATIKRFGQLDVLVNNAQSMGMAPVESVSDEVIAMTLESGLLATLYFMQAAFPHLKENGGSIINLGSAEGIRGRVGFGIYAATKEGIRGLSRVAAREWGKYQIRVNVINPAALSPAAEQYIKNYPVEWEKERAGIALGRLGDLRNDIGTVAAFLAGSESRYLTGQTLNVDGGIIML